MFLYTFSPRQIQFFLPPTLDAYTAFIRDTRARAHRTGNTALLEQLKLDIQPLPADGGRGSPAHLCWIGDRGTAARVVYFMHGGGYFAPAMAGHFEWALQAYVLPTLTQPAANNERVAVAFLQYTLAPTARFPEQLRQAARGLRQLLDGGRGGFRPGQVVVGGDSAGGNLTTQVLGHLLHPHPAAEEVVLSEPLAGAFLVSPWMSGDTRGRSFGDGWACDMLSAGVIEGPRRELFYVPRTGWMEWLRGWLWPNVGLEESKEFKEGKAWALMADVDQTWVEGMGKVVKKVYVTCGKHEVFRDQGIFLAESLKARNPDLDVTLEVAEKEAHDFILLEGGNREVGDATMRMKEWFSHI